MGRTARGYQDQGHLCLDSLSPKAHYRVNLDSANMCVTVLRHRLQKCTDRYDDL